MGPCEVTVDRHLVGQDRVGVQPAHDDQCVVVAADGERGGAVLTPCHPHGDGRRAVGLDEDGGRGVRDVAQHRADHEARGDGVTRTRYPPGPAPNRGQAAGAGGASSVSVLVSAPVSVTVRETVTTRIPTAVADTTANAVRSPCHSASAPTTTAVSIPPNR